MINKKYYLMINKNETQLQSPPGESETMNCINKTSITHTSILDETTSNYVRIFSKQSNDIIKWRSFNIIQQ